ATERMWGMCSATSTRPFGSASLSMEIPTCVIVLEMIAQSCAKTYSAFDWAKAVENLSSSDPHIPTCYDEIQERNFHVWPKRDVRSGAFVIDGSRAIRTCQARSAWTIARGVARASDGNW